MSKYIDLVGKRYGKLTVIRKTEERRGSFVVWECLCDCGNKCKVITGSLKNGNTMSCGCLSENNLRKGLKLAHSESKTRLYAIWTGMKRRCNNKNTKSYKNYGGRGIKVCKEWNDYVNFREWALQNGYSDNQGLSIERKDVNGNYCPENCEFIPFKEQSKNRRNTKKWIINGIERREAELCREYGIRRETFIYRINKGWALIDALTKPLLRREMSFSMNIATILSGYSNYLKEHIKSKYTQRNYLTAVKRFIAQGGYNSLDEIRPESVTAFCLLLRQMARVIQLLKVIY